MSNYVEAYISTEQSAARQNPRLSRPHGEQKRSSGLEKTARKGTQTPDTVALLKWGGGLSKPTHLCRAGDFQRVYAQGTRYDGRLMTAFIQPNGLAHHRIGLTSSRKAIGNAVERNRSKRLLRETFRLSKIELSNLQVKYDWVLNAKRPLLDVKLARPLEEFLKLLLRVASDEREAPIEACKVKQ